MDIPWLACCSWKMRGTWSRTKPPQPKPAYKQLTHSDLQTHELSKCLLLHALKFGDCCTVVIADWYKPLLIKIPGPQISCCTPCLGCQVYLKVKDLRQLHALCDKPSYSDPCQSSQTVALCAPASEAFMALSDCLGLILKPITLSNSCNLCLRHL